MRLKATLSLTFLLFAYVSVRQTESIQCLYQFYSPWYTSSNSTRPLNGFGNVTYPSINCSSDVKNCYKYTCYSGNITKFVSRGCYLPGIECDQVASQCYTGGSCFTCNSTDNCNKDVPPPAPINSTTPMSITSASTSISTASSVGTKPSVSTASSVSATPSVSIASSVSTKPSASTAPSAASLLINTNAPSSRGPFRCLQQVSSSGTASNSLNSANISLPTLSCSLTSIGCFKFVCLSGMSSFTMRGCLDPLQPQFGCQSLNAQCPGVGQCYTCSFGDNCNMDIPTPALPPIVTPPSAVVSAPRAPMQCLQQIVTTVSSSYPSITCSPTAIGCFKFVCLTSLSTPSYTIRGCNDPSQSQFSCQALSSQCPGASNSQCFVCNSSNNCNTDSLQASLPVQVTSLPNSVATPAPLQCLQQTFTPSSTAGSMPSFNTSYNANFSSVTCSPGISSCFRFSCATSSVNFEARGCYKSSESCNELSMHCPGYGACMTCYGNNCNSNPITTTTTTPFFTTTPLPTRETPLKCYQQFIPELDTDKDLLSPNSSTLTQVTCSPTANACFRFTRPGVGNLTIAGCSDPLQKQYNNCTMLLIQYSASGKCYTCNSDLCNTDPPQNVIFLQTPQPIISTTPRAPLQCLQQTFTPSTAFVPSNASLFSNSYNTTYPSITCGSGICFRAWCRSPTTNFDVKGCYVASISSDLSKYCPVSMVISPCSTDNCNYDPPITSTVPTTYVTRTMPLKCYQKFSTLTNESRTFSTDSLSLSQVTCALTASGCFTFSCPVLASSVNYTMMGCSDPTQMQYTCQLLMSRCPSGRCMTCNGDYCNTDPPQNVVSIQEPTSTTPRVPLQCMQQLSTNSSSTGTSVTCSSSASSCYTFACSSSLLNYTLRGCYGDLGYTCETLRSSCPTLGNCYTCSTTNNCNLNYPPTNTSSLTSSNIRCYKRQYTNSSNISGSLESAVTFTTCLASTTGCVRFSCPGTSNYTLRGCQQPEMDCQTFLSQCPGGTCYTCIGDLCNDDQISKMTVMPANPSVTMPMPSTTSMPTTTALTGVAKNPQQEEIDEKDEKFYSSQLNQKYNFKFNQ